jgi:thiopeptide-type bacteriocin biosynthesis protein
VKSEDFGADASLAPTTGSSAQDLLIESLLEHWLGAPDSGPPGLDAEAEQRLRRIFVRAGIDALRHATSSHGWVQFGVRPGREAQRSRMYASLLGLAHTLLHEGRARSFFFMHKEPGLRVRFELEQGDRAGLTQSVRAALEAEVGDGVIAALHPGIYEPETALFGGPRSMAHVHRLFTPDALMWLDFHARAHADPDLAGSAWALSFVVLRALFQGLRIVDWEDIDVWDRIRARTGRRLASEAAGLATLADLCEEVRAAWLDPARLLATLPEPLAVLGRTAALAIESEAERWREQYFTREDARLGPRAGAALGDVAGAARRARPHGCARHRERGRALARAVLHPRGCATRASRRRGAVRDLPLEPGCALALAAGVAHGVAVREADRLT